MFYYQDLETIVFTFHEILSEEPDELIILSGYLGPKPVEKLKELPFKVTVIGGMYSKGINIKLYNALETTEKNYSNVSVMFSSEEIHSKIYIWRKSNKILSALIGSANFSSKGLRTEMRETLAQANRGTFTMMNNYVNSIYSTSLKEPKIIDRSKIRIDNDTRTQDSHIIINDEPTCELPLYNIQKEKKIVSGKSGLNWGLSSGHTALGDAYIRLPNKIVQSNPLLFKAYDPQFVYTLSRKRRQSDPIELIWDDGVTMEASFEGVQKDKEGNRYPKQLTSYSLKIPKLPNGERISAKSILGRYLRKRLGVSLTEQIRYGDLVRYGRDTVTISKIEEGIYYCDFSTENGVGHKSVQDNIYYNK